MPNYLDDFVCNNTPEEYENSYTRNIFYEVECHFCEEMEIEPEVYED